MPDDLSLSLLNMFDVQDESGKIRHLICFLDSVRAGAEGINPKAIVGEIPVEGSVKPDEFDPKDFQLNAGFVENLTNFLNECGAISEELQTQARSITSGWLYLIDPRHQDPNVEPSDANTIGAFAVDDTGQIVPGSFLYNEKHRFFDPDSGMSGLLMNRDFYDWLNMPPK